MRKSYIYMILAVMGMMFSCQRIELPEDSQGSISGVGVNEEVTIRFSAQIPMPVQTKAMGDEPFMTDADGSLVKGDLQTMHLVVFDENGMLVETREATILTPVEGSHETGRYDKENPVILPEAQFEVTLTVTDRPRIIHFIANCPVEQISYGHESSIIANMFVTKANSEEDPKTEFETSYWGRVEFPYILVEEKKDADGKFLGYIPHNTIISKFQCIPMIRNFAQIVVRNSADNFNLEAFAIYNTIDKGTIAPYNNNTNSFQSFTFGTTNNQKYSYPQLTYPHLGFLTEPYEGHALASAQLNTDLHGYYSSSWITEPVRDAEGNYVKDEDGNLVTEQIQECTPYYMYERKVSARTDQEEMWNESPPHLIIKGKYNNGPSTYYKADLIYSRELNGMTSNHYYNILRNFRYQFTVIRVSGDGYPTPEEALNGAPSNNLSTSTTTTKFTNISDEDGRLFVSYTDTTLVNDNKISLLYKYIPDLSDLDENGDPKINNTVITGSGVGVKLDGFDGDVIEGYEVASTDITTGSWAGYRRISLSIKDPSAVSKNQTLTIRTDNPSLSRDVRYTLRNPYKLETECTEKVAAEIYAPVEVDVKLPIGLTQDMFPLELAIEIDNMSLSPDATKNTIQLPVKTGPSVIPNKAGRNTFHYVLTIETYEEYQAITTVNNQKIIKTYWRTNKANNESRVYVVNKYFEVASDNFINAKSFNGAFSKKSLGVNGVQTVDYLFDINAPLPSGMTLTVTLDRLAPIASGSGLVATGVAGVYTYTPSQAGRQTIHLQTTSEEEGKCTISISADDEYGYIDLTDTINQVEAVTYSGSNLTITETRVSRPEVTGGSGTRTYTATIDEISAAGAEITYDGDASYTYSNTNSGTLTISLDSLSVTGAELDEDTEITITVTITQKRGTGNDAVSASKEVTITRTISELKLSL